ncbi:coiled-coil domain-containing protein 42 homolog [Pangasianodon hypophthalmus]|uniref:coiled-coil domain-containing protein 42 homolog n=1 Tax=Pangasianodon hypophthalmus TaxID=310915 RepID=UPI00230801EE|nr:coiled-coil domain-containing protein 42 homolog [Pangasianodon hypophthalmus]
MSVKLEECIRTVFEEHLSESVSVQEKGVCSGVTCLLEKRRQIKHVDGVLRTQRREFEVKRESLRQRRDELKKEEENLKDSLLKFDKFLKENDAKRARGVKKAESERAVLRERERELELLHTHIAALLVKKEKLRARVERFRVYCEFLHTVLKTATKFEDVGQLVARFETLMSTREHLLRRQSEMERQRESDSLELRRYVSEQNSILLQYSNTLSQLQTELDNVLSHTLAQELSRNHIQAAAVKETHLLSQIKVVTLNLYHMTGGITGGDEGVDVDDTVEQLDRVRLYIEDRAEILAHLRSDRSSRSSRLSDGE